MNIFSEYVLIVGKDLLKVSLQFANWKIIMFTISIHIVIHMIIFTDRIISCFSFIITLKFCGLNAQNKQLKPAFPVFLCIGCAFVTFTARQVAQSAIKSMHQSQTMEVLESITPCNDHIFTLYYSWLSCVCICIFFYLRMF